MSSPARMDLPLTGRAPEREVLRDAVRRVARGQAQVIALGGTPGIGKSRLARDGLALALDAGFTVLSGTSGPLDRELSLAAVVEALRPLVDTGTGLGDGLADLARLFDGLAVPAPADLGDPGLERTRLFEAVRRLLDRATRTRPVAMLLDDVHWADAGTHALVQYLVRGLAQRRFLLLLTHRSGGPEAVTTVSLLAALRRSAQLTELTLRGLSAQQVGELAATVVNGAVPASLVEMLVERSAGVPLFVTEIVGALLGSGALHRSGDGWVFAADAGRPLPAAVVDVMRERIDAVPDAARDVLGVLALSPGAVPHQLLAAVLGEDRALAGVADLHAAGLLAEEDAAEGIAYRTAHPLLAEVEHERLPTVVRRRRHAGLARALRDGRPGGAEPSGSWHDLSRAAHHVRFAGAELPADEALAVLVPAAADAVRRRAGEEAAAVARAALERVPPDDPRRVGLLETLATAAETCGDSALAVQALLSAEEAAGPDALTARSEHLCRAAVAVWNLGRFEEAWDHLARAETLLGPLPRGPAHDAVRETRAGLEWRCDDATLERASDGLEALAQVTDSDRGHLMSLIERVVLMVRRGELGAAAVLVPQLYAVADATGDDLLCERVRKLGAQVWYNRGDLAAAEADALDGLRLVERIGVPTLGGVHLFNLTLLGQFRGDLAAERRWSGLLGDLAQAGRFDRAVLGRDAVRAIGLALRGRTDDVFDIVVAARRDFGHWVSGDRHVFSPLEYAECLALARSGAFSEARAAVERSLASGSILLGVCLEVLAETCVRTGDVGAAGQALGRLERVGAGSAWAAASAVRVRGLLLGEQDDPAGAAVVLQEAADALDRLGLARCAASTRLEAAQATLDADAQDADTEDAVRAVLAAAERMDAAADADRARALLRRLGVRPPIRTGRAPGAVAGTPGEGIPDLSPGRRRWPGWWRRA